MSYPTIRHYLQVSARNDSFGPDDVELLRRFVAYRDESAFELLVWRHAALVHRLCQTVLRDHHAAEDAAQAAFLILAQKAHTFSGRGSVIGWLYRIARRVAIRLAKDRARHPISSHQLDVIASAAQELSASSDELAALCVQVDRLPERYRVPVLLCFFEGLTHAEAARRTGWPVGTVAGRLARAKDVLASRLSRKDVGVATVLLTLPAGNFAGATARAAVAFSQRGAVVPFIKPSVSNLVEGVLKTMTATKLQLAAVVTTSCLAVVSSWTLFVDAATQPPPQPTQEVRLAQRATAQPAELKARPKERIASRNDQLETVNSLKQIMLAMHNYYSVNNVVPHDIVGKDGKPLLSWRVAILPYIEQQALYMEFKLDEPWDSDHNKKLLARMPRTYRLGFQGKDETKTHCLVFAGPVTAFEPGKVLKFTDITDGTANTLGVVVAGPAVEWTKPADIAYDPQKPLPNLDLPYNNIFFASYLDGSVSSLKPDLDPKIL
jgi:RNA polymerase sigma factor (sigma-70 family)